MQIQQDVKKILINSQMFTPSGLTVTVKRPDIESYLPSLMEYRKTYVCYRQPCVIPGDVYLDSIRRSAQVSVDDACLSLANIQSVENDWIRMVFLKVGFYPMQSAVASYENSCPEYKDGVPGAVYLRPRVLQMENDPDRLIAFDLDFGPLLKTSDRVAGY